MADQTDGDGPKGGGVNESRTFSVDPAALAQDVGAFCPIRYVYDYLPHEPCWPQQQQILPSSSYNRDAAVDSISLDLEGARLPLHSRLVEVRQCKHWQAAEDTVRELLQLVAQDQHCRNARLGWLASRPSIASLANVQLKSSVMDDYSRFNIYMFPDADAKRMGLISQSMLLAFMLDGELACIAPRRDVEGMSLKNQVTDAWIRLGGRSVFANGGR